MTVISNLVLENGVAEKQPKPSYNANNPISVIPNIIPLEPENKNWI